MTASASRSWSPTTVHGTAYDVDDHRHAADGRRPRLDDRVHRPGRRGLHDRRRRAQLRSGHASRGPVRLRATSRARRRPRRAATSTTLRPSTRTKTFVDDDDATVDVLCPDVTISKTADNSPILAGQDAEFTITAWNEGPGIARDVEIHDTLPAGYAWTEDSEDCEIVDGTLHCTVGDLEDNGTFTVHLSASDGCRAVRRHPERGLRDGLERARRPARATTRTTPRSTSSAPTSAS